MRTIPVLVEAIRNTETHYLDLELLSEVVCTIYGAEPSGAYERASNVCVQAKDSLGRTITVLDGARDAAPDVSLEVVRGVMRANIPACQIHSIDDEEKSIVWVFMGDDPKAIAMGSSSTLVRAYLVALLFWREAQQ